jgi:hypothetical protein
VKEWLDYCCNPKILIPMDQKEIQAECSYFVAHREDQSVLSLLVKKYNIKAYQDPSQFAVFPERYCREKREHIYYPEEDYHCMIVHHRRYEIDIKFFVLQSIYTLLPRRLSRKIYLLRNKSILSKVE